MQDMIHKAVYDPDAAWELSKIHHDPQEVVESVSELDRRPGDTARNEFKTVSHGVRSYRDYGGHLRI